MCYTIIVKGRRGQPRQPTGRGFKSPARTLANRKNVKNPLTNLQKCAIIKAQRVRRGSKSPTRGQ